MCGVCHAMALNGWCRAAILLQPVLACWPSSCRTRAVTVLRRCTVSVSGFNNTRAFDVTPRAGGVSSTLGSIDFSRFHLKGHGGLHARVQTDCTVPVPAALASEGALGGSTSMQSSFAFLAVMEPCPGGWGPGGDNVCIRCPPGFYSVKGNVCKACVGARCGTLL